MNAREKILIKTSWISVIGNAILSLLKIIIGIVSGSLAVVGDGIDSATDVITSIVILYTSRIINRPPDMKYVFGYEKAETIATKVLSFVIFFAGIEMFISTAKNLIYSESRALPSFFAVYVTLFSIFGKLFLSAYQYKQGKKTDSSMLIANAQNMRMDIFISIGVLSGLFFTFILRAPWLDSVTGLLISIYIIKTSISMFIETNVALMDGIKDTSIYKQIIHAVEQVPGAMNPHRIRSRQLGNLYVIGLDIEVDGNLPLHKAHDIAQAVEENIKKNIDNIYDIIVHVEPAGIEQTKEKFGIDKNNLPEP
ncbi:MAG: cation diffusion facilitator family transporter [Massilibacteroides sp.]|nr:cation diffusion facilitator family transporter [Massilibacteroides sp.]MDD3063108.1 cation diffusion facilitator family transporter [Massilibacteroides sp.]MDD4660502.1 cation diffusion facilitator family transporter [Massilibacteroides sp.]